MKSTPTDMFRRPDVVAGEDLPADAAAGTPSKRIRTSADITAFAASPAHADINRLLHRWGHAVAQVPRSAIMAADPVDSEKQAAGEAASGWKETLPESDASGARIGPAVRGVWKLLSAIRAWALATELQDMKAARFGNPAYRDFHARLVADSPALLRELVALRAAATSSNAAAAASSSSSATSPSDDECVAELKGYICDSFGNAQRIDFGTGHELHFILFLLVAEKMGILAKVHDTTAATSDGGDTMNQQQQQQDRQVVHILIWGYIELMRLLQARFRMEPAGSHGVWGLDDYHHVPFILGAAQLSKSTDAAPSSTCKMVPVAELPKPVSIADEHAVRQHRHEWLYFTMIGWIRDNKRGPFHEHSSVLYNVSGLESWERIANGMLKMFDGEVLQKINIVQHLLFGRHFAFPSTTSSTSARTPFPGSTMPPGSHPKPTL